MHLVNAHSDEKSEDHALVHFTVANGEPLPITKYVMELILLNSLNPSHKGSKPAPRPETSDKVTRSSRVEFGAPGLQEVHKIIWDYSFLVILLPKWCEPIVVFTALHTLLHRCLDHSNIRLYVLPWETPMGMINPLKKPKCFPAIRRA